MRYKEVFYHPLRLRRRGTEIIPQRRKCKCGVYFVHGNTVAKINATVSWRGKQPERGEVLFVVPSPLSPGITPCLRGKSFPFCCVPVNMPY